jgi:hypothetical protein
MLTVTSLQRPVYGVSFRWMKRGMEYSDYVKLGELESS